MTDPVAAASVHLAIAPDAADRAQYVPGQIVTGVVLSRSANNQAMIDIGGRTIAVKLPDELQVGSPVTLRVQSVTVAEMDAELQVQQPSSPFGGIDARAVTQNMMRFVDAAATRFFGSAAEQRATIEMEDPPIRFVTRGDLPRNAPIELDPESLKNSSALANATSEDLLAAQAALERLAVPATPITVAAALPNANDPSRLAAVLLRLESLLGDLPEEALASTAFILASFLSRFAPQEEEAAAQLSAFVDQIAIGPESKLMAILDALASRAHAHGADRLLLTARATERATALTSDLKTQIFSLLATVEDETLLSALTEALEALTAAQLTSLNAAKAVPGALSFVIPVAVGNGSLPAHITVQREAGEGDARRPLDAENFRISLSIETKRMGTVKVRLEAVGGSMRIAFDSTTTVAAEHIRAHLDELSDAVIARRFRIVAISSEVAMKMSRKEVLSSRSTYVPTLRGTFAKKVNVHVDTKA